MNSKQRRKDKRAWKYSVKVLAKDYDHYEEMWNWLDKNYGRKIYKCGWRDRYPSDSYFYSVTFEVIWQFTDQKKLVEFILRWA